MSEKSSSKNKHNKRNNNQLSQNSQNIQNTENISNGQKISDSKIINKIQNENQSSNSQIPNGQTKNYCLRCLNCSLIPFMILNPETHKLDIECNEGHKFSMEVSEYLQKGFAKNFINLSCSKCKLKINQDNEINFVFCRQCNELLCSKCERNHNTLFHNNSKNNNWEISLDKFDTTCEKHNQSFDFYCYSCHKNICQNCYEEDHKNHITVDLDDVDLKRKQLKKIKDKLAKEKNIIEKLNYFINDVLKELENEIDKIIKDKKNELIFKENVIKTYDNKIDNFNIIKNVKSLTFLTAPIDINENFTNFQKLEYFFNYINNVSSEENEEESLEMSASRELQMKSNYNNLQRYIPVQISQNSFLTEKSDRSHENKVKKRKKYKNSIKKYYSINEGNEDFDDSTKIRLYKSLINKNNNSGSENENEILEYKKIKKKHHKKKGLIKLNNEIKAKLLKDYLDQDMSNSKKDNYDSCEVILIENDRINSLGKVKKQKKQNFSTSIKKSKIKYLDTLSINDSDSEKKNENNVNKYKENPNINNSKELIHVNTNKKKIEMQINNSIERNPSEGSFTFQNDNNQIKEINAKNDNKLVNNSNLTNSKDQIKINSDNNKSNNFSIFTNDNNNTISDKDEKIVKNSKLFNIKNNQLLNNNIIENKQKPIGANISTYLPKQKFNNPANINNDNNSNNSYNNGNSINNINNINNNKTIRKKNTIPKYNKPKSNTVPEFMPKGSVFNIKEINNGICSLLELNSKYFAAGYLNGEIDIYDSNTVSCLFSFMEHKDRVNNMILLKDKSILTQSFDNSMKKIKISIEEKTYFIELVFDDYEGAIYKCIELNNNNLISISFGGFISIWQKQNTEYGIIKQQQVVNEKLYDIMEINNKEYVISTNSCLRFFEVENYQNTNTIYNLDLTLNNNNMVKINNNILGILLTKEIALVDVNTKNIVKKIEIIGGKLEIINLLINDNSLLIGLSNNISKDSCKLIFKQFDTKDNKIELKAEREDKIHKKINKDFFSINSVIQLENRNIVVGISGSEEQKPIGIISIFEY